MPDTSPEPPRKVALFSGHMIDAPGREKPRFPPDKEPIAARAIAEALADLRVGPADLAICGGACGGDLLFAEAALAARRASRALHSFRRADLSRKVGRFRRPRLARPIFRRQGARRPSCRPERARPDPGGEDAYERNNRWMLDSALRFGADKVDFVCLWNGEGGDGPGGTRHMMDAVRNRGGRTRWLDTTKLWG